jgi:hypothetical protein
MSNFLDYLAWRGDLTFEKDPFNSIDALILSTLSYVDFKDVVPGRGEGIITIEEASEKFFKIHSEEELAQNKSFINYAPALLKALAGSERFRKAYLLNFVDDTDISREIQFAAVEIDTSDGTSFISFRGTDDTIIGWKEDFNLSYMTVPSENEAALYLKDVTEGRKETVRIGGHSKGGHLAIYAAMTADPEISSRIEKVYSFDGPGFNHEAMESEKFRSVQPKIIKIIPETSIIGRLLENSTEPVVVKSTELGIMQHDPKSWQLEGKRFETCASTDKISDAFDETMSIWLGEMSFDDRKVFVDELFSVFEASGCEYLSTMTKVGVRGTRAMIERMGQIRNDSGAKVRTLVKMFLINLNTLKDNVLKEKFEEKTRRFTLASNKKNKTESLKTLPEKTGM